MTDLLPGFSDPVEAAQASFRSVLDAMSRPGSLHTAGTALAPPAPMSPATGALLLTLADQDTPVFLAPAFAAAAGWLRFHCGADLVENPAAARFVVTDELPDLTTLDTGTDEGPEDSATLILQLPALGEGAGFTLAGPGLRAPTPLHATGLPADFAASWAANHALFPRGIDLILTAGTTLTALPRSVRVA